MSQAHTPGPWQIKSNMEPEYIVGDIDGPLEGNVMHYSPVAVVMETKHFEANARLIAAAPELFSALSTMLTHMGMDEDEWNRQTFKQARAAIAKATGAAT